MSFQATFLTPAEYLELERRAEWKSEYFQGEMFAMAGASLEHAEIIINLARELSQRLKGRPCHVYSTDVRLRVAPNGLYTYPDVMVICGDPQLADDRRDTVLNPALIVEVLSESTQDYDRGRKFQQYRKLPSLLEYLVVAQDTPRVEQYTRQPDNRWLLSELSGKDASIQLASVDCIVPLSEIYDKVD